MREPLSIQKTAEIEHQRRELILKLKRQTGLSLISLGKELYEAEKNKAWLSLGFDSWSALVVAPDQSGGYGLTKHFASKLKTIWEHYVLKGVATVEQLAEVGEPYKLYEARKYLTSPEKFENINLPLSEIRKLEKGIDEVSCEHDWLQCWKCKNCSTLIYRNP